MLRTKHIHRNEIKKLFFAFESIRGPETTTASTAIRPEFKGSSFVFIRQSSEEERW
ncbi:hypothetical protein M408DRAFT_333560 [Serendipita vermifera MAFF 305830]|uniref:Uncharacterized protein n=1 Tax=Serendipita vermifera MAFF 305830 TaxID=933852 RepID=A0A0C3A9L0_SERVB|nr:hypothetical protein M408DRAFT_333560 [Serendipita vermifera MAFF 305830]